MPNDKVFLTKADPMPPEPPTVTVNGIPALRLTSRWIINGAVTEERPEPTATFDLPDVPTTAPLVEFHIDHPSKPTLLYIETFTDLDSTGTPVGDGVKHECPINGQPSTDSDCTVTANDDGLDVALRLQTTSPTVAVLQTLYATLPDVRATVADAPANVTASWGVTLQAAPQ